ncbi:armadillo-like helical domain containing protein 1 [Clytia hemisphaerica]|uniref:Armadillo repeat containing protein n=1 Tax=Clytia hemisphaerica TaxID=252671 RepID=A0A7M5TTQ5_9CNID
MTGVDVKRFLQKWDDSSKQSRVEILQDFNKKHCNKTAPELDQVLGNCASLFFTRITAWLRLSYMNGSYLDVQLKTLNVFLSASSGQKFLSEFIEVGGILTLLEIIGLPKISEVHKELTLKLLNNIASTGRKYKELVCECYGVRAVCECLGKSQTLGCQEACRLIIINLSNGNPRYLQQLYKAMIILLKSASPEAQRIAAQALQKIQPSLDTASLNIVDPTLMLLSSLHIEVQYEGCVLVRMLIQYQSIRQDILVGLVALLKPSQMELLEQSDVVSAQVPVFIQQAVTAKLIGVLSKEDFDIARNFLELDCITSLLFAMSNEKYADSQKQAGITLQYFIHTFQEVELGVREAIGQSFFFEYMNDPSDFYLKMTSVQIDILKGSKVKIHQSS